MEEIRDQNLDDFDTVDISEHFEKKIEEIKDRTVYAFRLEDDLEETLINMIKAFEYLIKRLAEEELNLAYYNNCFNNVKDELLIKYKYGKVLRDPKRIDTTVQSCLEWEKHDLLCFGQKSVCDFIEQRIKALKNQIFSVKDIIDYKKAFIA